MISKFIEGNCITMEATLCCDGGGGGGSGGTGGGGGVDGNVDTVSRRLFLPPFLSLTLMSRFCCLCRRCVTGSGVLKMHGRVGGQRNEKNGVGKSSEGNNT